MYDVPLQTKFEILEQVLNIADQVKRVNRKQGNWFQQYISSILCFPLCSQNS